MASMRLAAPLAGFLALSAFAFGGWSVISVQEVPDQLTAGRPATLAFTIRQHGAERQAGLKPTVTVRGKGDPVTVAAEPGAKAGDYKATITLPTPGEWGIDINSNFGRSRLNLLPTLSVAPGATAPAVSGAARGRRLFIAKGCVTCHVHPQAEGTGNESTAAGPPLGATTLDAPAISTILTNGLDRGNGKKMPNPELRPAEVAALTAFLTGPQQAMANPAR